MALVLIDFSKLVGFFWKLF